MATYFASDGNYGDANDLVVIDTTDWGFSEWTLIEQAGDNERSDVAAGIASIIKSRELMKGEK